MIGLILLGIIILLGAGMAVGVTWQKWVDNSELSRLKQEIQKVTADHQELLTKVNEYYADAEEKKKKLENMTMIDFFVNRSCVYCYVDDKTGKFKCEATGRDISTECPRKHTTCLHHVRAIGFFLNSQGQRVSAEDFLAFPDYFKST